MRRAVGDRKPAYVGFSYGTAIGQCYANMFPDRFRAIAVDGVINPRAWVYRAAPSRTIGCAPPTAPPGLRRDHAS